MNNLIAAMIFVYLWTFTIVLLALPRDSSAQEHKNSDWRNIRNGYVIPTPGMKYVDQPYVVHTSDGSWLCILTVGTLGETIKGSVNYSAATVSEDKGKTWSPFMECNITYAVPLKVPSGRIYTLRPPNSFTYSDDNGATWSERHNFPDSVAVVGGVRSGWSVSMPIIANDAVCLAWAKVGLNRPPRKTEVFFYKSDNILTEKDPGKIRWLRLPDGDIGLRGPDWDKPENRSEEPHVVSLSDGTLYTVWRTDQGYIGHSTSKDRGMTWSDPVYLTYKPGGRRIKNPLACPSLWKCSNGKYLLWMHNHSGKTYSDRNPAWVCGGVEKDSGIEWSQPEILLYSDDLSYHSGRLSYPGFLEENGRYWIFETQKTAARVHEIDPTLFEAAWNQDANSEIAEKGLILSLGSDELEAAEDADETQDSRPKTQDTERKAQDSPESGVLSLGSSLVNMPRLPNLATDGGFAVDLWLTLKDLSPDQIVLDSRDDDGRGIAVATTQEKTLRLDISDGKLKAGWDCDPGLLKEGTLHHIVFIVDGGPKIITVVVDGRLCDGGDSRQYGWGRSGEYNKEKDRYTQLMGDVTGAAILRIAPSLKGKLKSLRIYNRYLRTSEAIGNYHTGLRT